ncbi:MAG: hypothetical protein M3065_21800 [Actinomycetota bacterium]|nr:hypothetical protein [Actinomycetota bacterium]
MPWYSFTVTAHDAGRPWLIIGTEQHSAELDEDVNFFEWDAERWPGDRYTVQLAPALKPWHTSP